VGVIPRPKVVVLKSTVVPVFKISFSTPVESGTQMPKFTSVEA